MNRFMIYFFGTDFERVKIGHCKSNLYTRKRQIQTGCPDPIKLLGVILCRDKEDMEKCEMDLHKRFKEHNTVGEWFRLVPEISDYIQKSAESGQDILKKGHEERHEERREERKTPEYKESRRKRRERPEVKERRREENRKYRERPEYSEQKREYLRKYRERPEVKERSQERYKNDPKHREYQKKYQQERRARKKRENQKTTEQQLTLF